MAIAVSPFSGRLLSTTIREDSFDFTPGTQGVSRFVQARNFNPPESIEPSGPSNDLFLSDPPGRSSHEDTEFLNSLVPISTGDWML
jgi:hypothetical protein